MGVAFDPATAWDERKQLFMSSGLIIKTTQVTQSAIGDKSGLWTSVIAAVVFLPATATTVQDLSPSIAPAV
jgi:arginine decarboxylase